MEQVNVAVERRTAGGNTGRDSRGDRRTAGRDVVRKGLLLRKRCGQFKPKESYLHDEPALTFGYSPISIDELSEKLLQRNETCRKSEGVEKKRTCIFVPSEECLLFFTKVLYEMSASVTADVMLLMTQTVLSSVLSNAQYSARKEVHELLQNCLTLKPVVFLNELCSYTATLQHVAIKEDPSSYNFRQISVAVKYFFDRLVAKMNHMTREDEVQCIFLVADDNDIASHQIIDSLSFVTQTITMRQFIIDSVGGIDKHCPLWELFELAMSSRQSHLTRKEKLDSPLASSGRADEFIPHLSATEVAKGLQNGNLVKGKLNVFPYSTSEAEVVFSQELTLSINDEDDTKSISRCLVSGNVHRNRALHGDEVVIQMLPRGLWKGRTSAVHLQRPSVVDVDVIVNDANIDCEKLKPSTLTNVTANIPSDALASPSIPTGQIVSIFKRDAANNEIVAVFPVTNMNALESYVDKREKLVLLIPLERRLPKIMVRTRNWVSFSGRRVVVTLDHWELRNKYPIGHIVRLLSPVKGDGSDVGADLKADVEALMLKNCIHRRPFSIEAMACLPDSSNFSSGEINTNNSTPCEEEDWKDSNWQIAAKDMKHRRDLRGASAASLSTLMNDKSNLSNTATSQENCNIFSSIATSFDKECDDVAVDITIKSNVESEVEKIRIFSVDPKGCQDIDDAMSITPSATVPPGSFLLGIHIADVTSFIPEGCALDLEARSRATTVYLPHTRLDMFPALLASDVASLHGGQRDRFAMTLFFKIRLIRKSTGVSPISEDSFCTGSLLRDTLLALDNEDDLDVVIPAVPCWAGRTALRSDCAMTYDQAHRLMHDQPPDAEDKVPVKDGVAGGPVARHLWSPLTGDLAVLTVISRALARKRQGAGALDLEQSEGGQLKFGLDPTSGLPRTVAGSAPLEIHNTIAELMILANGAVARLIYRYMPSSTLLRSHGSASAEKLKEIHDMGATMGLKIFEPMESENISNSGITYCLQGSNDLDDSHSNIIARSDKREKARFQLQQYKDTVATFWRQHRKLGDKNDPAAAMDFFTSMVIRAMNEAKYVCSESSNSASEVADGKNIENPGKQFEHFGLGLNFYTHYTSPIRRYADVIVHRQLNLVLQFISAERQIKEAYSTCIDDTLIDNCGGVNHTPPIPSAAVPLVNESREMTIAHDLSRNSVDCVNDGEEDMLDFLDDMLDGVGESLSSTVLLQQQDSSTSEMMGGDEFFLNSALKDVNDELIVSDKLITNSFTKGILLNKSIETATKSDGVVISSENQAASSPLSVLYPPGQLSRIAKHLNEMNRRSKRAQTEAQDLFLRHYFAQTCEIHHALVYSLRDNGFLAFIPAFQFKGPVYLTNAEGVVFCHPQVLRPDLFPNKLWSVGDVVSDDDSVETLFENCVCSLKNITNSPHVGDTTDHNFEELVVIDESGKCGETHPTLLRLQHMQRVLVTVTSRPSKPDSNQIVAVSGVCSVPELHLSLFSTQNVSSNLKSDLVENSSRGEEYKSSENTRGGNLGILESDKKLDNSAIDKTCDKSVYSLLNSFRGRTLMGGYAGTPEKKQENNASNYDKTQGWRWDLPNTGRICFAGPSQQKIHDCDNDLKLDFQPSNVFRSKGRLSSDLKDEHRDKTQLSKSGGKAIGGSKSMSLDNEIIPASSGREIAMQRMKKWGEAWAEEEELPSSDQTESEDSSLNSSSLRKQVVQATARQQKLKIAKKNSKY